MRRELPRGFYIGLFFVLIAGNINAYKAILAPRALTVNVLEAGKGKAVLVSTPNSKTILIDTGPDASTLRALGESLPVWQRDIDAVILTSSAAGYAGGLPAVEARYRISKLIRIGGKDIPYGTSITFDGSRIEITAPATLTISSGSSVFNISSSTPTGTYASDGQTVMKMK